MRIIPLVLAPLACATIGCAARHSSPPAIVGEVRGIYLQGMEGSLFRLCDDTTSFGQSIAFQAGVARPTPWPEGGRSTWRDWTHSAYYARLVVRQLSSGEPSGTQLRISSGPQLGITKVIEFRMPKPGECGWREGELRDPAP